jgi:methionyl-tRNA formyltransferase
MIKVEFLTQDDELYILPFFEEFFAEYGREFSITQVSSSQMMGSRPRSKMIRELMALYGAAGFAFLAARTFAGKFLGRVPASSRRKRFFSLAQLCKAQGVEYRRIGNPNAADFREGLAARKPDLLVSVACPYLIKEPLLSAAPLGSINIHHAPLPRYQGMMPTFWQLYSGEKSVGLTIHYMAAKIDAGDAILRDQLAVQPGESLHELMRRSKRHGARQMGAVIRRFAADGRLPTLPPVEGEATYFTFPTLQQVREFRERGFRGV